MRRLPLPRVAPATGAVLALVTSNAPAADPAPKPGANGWYLAAGHGGHRMLSRDGKTWEKHAS